MVLGRTEYQLHQFSMCEWVISCHLTWREQHSSTEKSNLLVRHLYTAQAFSQVKHSIHKVVTAFGDREGKKMASEQKSSGCDENGKPFKNDLKSSAFPFIKVVWREN